MTPRGGLYPIVLRPDGRRALVVEGGKVAARCVGGLLEAGARVVVVSPRFAPGFHRLVATRRVACVERSYRVDDMAGADLAIAATNNREVNARGRSDAKQAGVPVCVVDDPEHSDFIVPAVIRGGDLLLAISTGGASPGLVGQLRRELDLLVPEDAALLVRLLARACLRVRGAFADPDRRRDVLTRLLSVDLVAALRAGGDEAVARLIDDDLIARPADHRPAPAETRPADG
jgi:precorrin-2 dehydrogenase/sirohydrochlorin ferrochelatase